MKLFLDTADIAEIKQALDTGYLDGLTTNPSLVSKTGRNYHDIAGEISNLVPGDVSLEVIATNYEQMLTEARALAKVNENVVVKLPLTPAGLKACQVLSGEGIRINMTLIFSTNQALLAAKCGAYYASIFVGRLDDTGASGDEIIAETRQVYDQFGYNTQILFASVRTTQHITDAAILGADVATIPFEIFMKLNQHPLTDAGLAKFLADYAKLS